MQSSPSSQNRVLFSYWQPLAGSQLSVVQTLESSQSRGVPGWQKLETQVSVPLHRLASSQSASMVQGAQAESAASVWCWSLV